MSLTLLQGFKVFRNVGSIFGNLKPSCVNNLDPTSWLCSLKLLDNVLIASLKFPSLIKFSPRINIFSAFIPPIVIRASSYFWRNKRVKSSSLISSIQDSWNQGLNNPSKWMTRSSCLGIIAFNLSMSPLVSFVSKYDFSFSLIASIPVFIVFLSVFVFIYSSNSSTTGTSTTASAVDRTITFPLGASLRFFWRESSRVDLL